jgi:hypothetical protein
MKRTNRFVQSLGVAICLLPSGEEIRVPIVPGILKHPTAEALAKMLEQPDVVRKYTITALQKAPWPVLRQFQRSWLRECLPKAKLDPCRSRALEFLLGD